MIIVLNFTQKIQLVILILNVVGNRESIKSRFILLVIEVELNFLIVMISNDKRI